MAEREGFEPPEPCGSAVFKTAAIDHSATSPYPACLQQTTAILLGRVVIKSHGNKQEWCREQESNLRPTHYECAALPTELFRHQDPDGTIGGADIKRAAGG